MHLTFFDTESSWSRLLPLTYTRPTAELRVGILKIQEKWKLHLDAELVSFRTRDFLQKKFQPPHGRSLHLFGGLLPNASLIKQAKSLEDDEVLMDGELLIAGYFDSGEPIEAGSKRQVQVSEAKVIEYPWDIFRLNGSEIKQDFDALTANRASQPLTDPHTKTYGDSIFIEEGATIRAAILNAENGPIYLGKNTEVQEGAIIRGPFALCEHSVVNMGSKIKGDSTVGPHSKVGGEVSNSVLQGYSNKGHDGFIGNTVIGEWCNLGADTNTSNLKNNYANVKMWDFETGRFKDTGLQFCGLIMGDHSKCGINTMLNTGTTVGVSANVFGDGFPRNFIPSYAWGGASGFSTYKTNKVFETAALVMERRDQVLDDVEKDILSHIFEMTASYRLWEKK